MQYKKTSLTDIAYVVAKWLNVRRYPSIYYSPEVNTYNYLGIQIGYSPFPSYRPKKKYLHSFLESYKLCNENRFVKTKKKFPVF